MSHMYKQVSFLDLSLVLDAGPWAHDLPHWLKQYTDIITHGFREDSCSAVHRPPEQHR